MNSTKPTCTTLLKVFAVALLTLVAMQGQSSDDPTTNDCVNAWTSSSASASCGKDTTTTSGGEVIQSVDTSSYHVVAQNNACYVEVDCSSDNHMQNATSNTFSGSTGDVKNLKNCDGDLTVGNCAEENF